MQRKVYRRPLRNLQSLCAQAYNKVSAFDEMILEKTGETCIIPYMGIGRPPHRPGGAINFVCIPEFHYFMEFLDMNMNRQHHVYLLGPKGIGKSCLLRAAAMALFKEKEPHERLVCLWNMEGAFSRGLVEALRDALLFTYCQEGEEVFQKIQEITELNLLVNFVKERKNLGDNFFFIVDGAQCLDQVDSAGNKREDSYLRSQCKEQLMKVVSLGIQCLMGLSPGASAGGAAEVKRLNDHNCFELRNGFDQSSYETFVTKTAIKAATGDCPRRLSEVAFLAGQHPWSLARLNECISDHIRSIDGKEQSKKRSYWEVEKEDMKGPAVEKQFKKDVEQLMRLEEDWKAVTSAFTSFVMKLGPSIKKIIESKLRYTTKDYFTVKDIKKVDPRFVMSALGYRPAVFCSPLIHKLYTETFREVLRHGPWIEYCKYLRKHGRGIMWSEMGWLCQHVVKDVVAGEQGLQFGNVHLKKLRVLPFNTIPSEKDWMPLFESAGESGVFCYPQDPYSLHVDGVIIWRHRVNGDWEYHFFGVQLTVNHKGHLRVADKFMNLCFVQEWIPRILEERKRWKLHYTFVTWVHEAAKTVPANLKRASGIIFGRLGYELGVYDFKSALRHAPTAKDETLNKIVRKREAASIPLQAHVQQGVLEDMLSELSKVALLKLARKHGVGEETCRGFSSGKVEQSIVINELIKRMLTRMRTWRKMKRGIMGRSSRLWENLRGRRLSSVIIGENGPLSPLTEQVPGLANF